MRRTLSYAARRCGVYPGQPCFFTLLSCAPPSEAFKNTEKE